MTDFETQKVIGKNIKEARAAARLTQLEVAEKAGINVNYYAKIERGEAISSLMTLKKILKVIGAHSSIILPF